MASGSSAAQRIALIVNTRSRSGRQGFAQAYHLLGQAGVAPAMARAVEDPVNLQGAIVEALAAGCDRIIIGGGDGTVSAAAGQLAAGDVALAILPLGTANSFARGAGIPLRLDEAVHTATCGRVDRIALGRAGERYFVNGVALGLPVNLSESTPNWFKRVAGPLSYGVMGLACLGRYAGFRCRLESDGRICDMQAIDLRIANGGYQGGVLVAEGAKVDSADLLVRVVEGRSVWPLARAWGGWLAGRRDESKDVKSWRTRSVAINTEPSQLVAADGEIIGRTPIHVAVAPGALRLVRPANLPPHSDRA